MSRTRASALNSSVVGTDLPVQTDRTWHSRSMSRTQQAECRRTYCRRRATRACRASRRSGRRRDLEEHTRTQLHGHLSCLDGRRTLLLLRGSEGSALGVGGHDAQIGGWRVVSVNRRLLPAVYKRVIYRETGLIMGDMTLPACRRLSRSGSDYRFLSTGILSEYASIRRSLASMRGPEAVVRPSGRTPKHRGSDGPGKVNGLAVAGRRHYRHREGAT